MLTEAERAAAGGIQQRHQARVAAIRSDVCLSDHGKRSALARATLAAREGMAKLRADSGARTAQRRADLERTLFGPGPKSAAGTDVLAARDARDRAAQISTPAEAAGMLARAERAGDASLARAIFEKCWDQVGELDIGDHWADVGAGYLASRPKDQAAAAELGELLSPTPTDQIRDRITTELQVPAEVARGDLQALAAERGDPDESAGAA
jgi:hypothetical protein